MPRQYAPKVSWPEWTDVRELWRSLDIPEVEVRPWPKENFFAVPWDKKETYGKSNSLWPIASPEDQTAHHIVKELWAQPEDVQIAYKLEAFCREHELDSFFANVVQPVYRKNNLEYPFWWHSNAKHVLPSGGGTWRLERLEVVEAREWKEIVRRSAEAWRELASEWVVVRVPDLMDHDSQEYLEFLAVMRARNEDRERREYERLRARFETTGTPPAL